MNNTIGMIGSRKLCPFYELVIWLAQKPFWFQLLFTAEDYLRDAVSLHKGLRLHMPILAALL